MKKFLLINNKDFFDKKNIITEAEKQIIQI